MLVTVLRMCFIGVDTRAQRIGYSYVAVVSSTLRKGVRTLTNTVELGREKRSHVRDVGISTNTGPSETMGH